MLGDYPEPLFLDDIDEISCPHCGFKQERSEWETLYKNGQDFVVCPHCQEKIRREDLG